MKPNSSLAGWYVGICNDSPKGSTANFMLNIYGATDTSLQGELAYFDELNIVVPFRGIIVDDQIAFTTVSPGAQALVIWQGTISELEWTGTALLCSNNPKINPGLEPQEGFWSCKIVQSAGAINPAEANTVWVYHDGVEYGPFTSAEFIQRLNACEWPRNAIVGLIDRTIWMTAGEYWTKAREPAPVTNYLLRRSHSLWQRLMDKLELFQMPRRRSSQRVRPRRKPQMLTPALERLTVEHSGK
jgi:hypothetical protein